MHPAQHRKADRGDKGTHPQSRDYRRRALNKKRYEYGEQADDRKHEPDQRFYPGAAADYRHYHKEEQHENDQDGYPVELVDCRAVFAILMGLYGEHHATALGYGHAGERPEIVVSRHRFALVDAAVYDYGQLLAACFGALGRLVGLHVLIDDLLYGGGVEVYPLVAVYPEHLLLAVEYAAGVDPDKSADKNDSRYRQHYDGAFSAFFGQQLISENRDFSAFLRFALAFAPR